MFLLLNINAAHAGTAYISNKILSGIAHNYVIKVCLDPIDDTSASQVCSAESSKDVTVAISSEKASVEVSLYDTTSTTPSTAIASVLCPKLFSEYTEELSFAISCTNLDCTTLQCVSE